MILIPSIDLRAGRCVRLLKGNFDAEWRKVAPGVIPAHLRPVRTEKRD